MGLLARKLIANDASAPDLTYAYASITAITTDATSYTFTAAGVGTAGSNRTLIIAVANANLSGSSTPSISDLTVNGASAGSPIYQRAAGTNAVFVTFYAYQLTSGTTADIVATFSETATRCGIAVYAVYDLQSTTPKDSAEDLSSPCALALDITPGDLILAAAYGTTGSTTEQWSWTNATEDAELDLEGSARPFSVASYLSATTATRTVTASLTGGSTCAVGIVLR